MVSLISPAMVDFELAVRMSYTYYTGNFRFLLQSYP